MAQEDIIKYIIKVGKPVDIHELLVNIPLSRNTISVNCKRLIKSGELKVKVCKYNKFLYYIKK
jgi:predicted transcriptional regulator